MPSARLIPLLLGLSLLAAATTLRAWPTPEALPASKATTAKTGSLQVSRDCEDLSEEPITYGMEYDLPGSGLPEQILDIHDIWLSGGCVGCHNSTAMGELQLDDPEFAGSQLVNMPSYRNFDLIRVLPFKPEDSVLYAQLNCTPPGDYPTMPPPDGVEVDRIPRRLRAMVYDWIAQGARGRGLDGIPLNDNLFRDSLESTRQQRNLRP